LPKSCPNTWTSAYGQLPSASRKWYHSPATAANFTVRDTAGHVFEMYDDYSDKRQARVVVKTRTTAG